MTTTANHSADQHSLQVGMIISGDVIDILRNNLPPVLDWSNLFQAGGAVIDRLLPDGSLRTAYSTFRRIDANAWEYCGACLKGESKERGEIPPYEKRNII